MLLASRPLQRLDRTFTGGEQTRPLRGRLAGLAIGSDEFDFWRDEQNGVGLRCEHLPPRRRGPIRHKGDTVPVLKEFSQPGDKPVAATERRVHPDEAAPLPLKAVGGDKLNGGDPWRDAFTWARHVHVVGTAKRIENVRRRVPLVCRSNALFVQRHASLLIL